jgi:hypothetical protein
MCTAERERQSRNKQTLADANVEDEINLTDDDDADEDINLEGGPQMSPMYKGGGA